MRWHKQKVDGSVSLATGMAQEEESPPWRGGPLGWRPQASSWILAKAVNLGLVAVW